MAALYPTYHSMMPGTVALNNQPYDDGHLEPSDCQLIIRQQPKETLVTQAGKEKNRKPVDPPPIIEMKMKDYPNQYPMYMQNPGVFMCVSLYRADRDEAYGTTIGEALAGTLVSSMHRLKDTTNQESAFFIFGDISCRIAGSFRLRFDAYEFRTDMNGQAGVQHLCHMYSEPFDVKLSKDFKGLDESTFLSRAFSDQGVRLRLRKDNRSKRRRSFPSDSVQATNPPIRPNNTDYSQAGGIPNPPLHHNYNDYTPPNHHQAQPNYIDYPSSARSNNSPLQPPGRRTNNDYGASGSTTNTSVQSNYSDYAAPSPVVNSTLPQQYSDYSASGPSLQPPARANHISYATPGPTSNPPIQQNYADYKDYGSSHDEYPPARRQRTASGYQGIRSNAPYPSHTAPYGATAVFPPSVSTTSSIDTNFHPQSSTFGSGPAVFGELNFGF